MSDNPPAFDLDEASAVAAEVTRRRLERAYGLRPDIPTSIPFDNVPRLPRLSTEALEIAVRGDMRTALELAVAYQVSVDDIVRIKRGTSDLREAYERHRAQLQRGSHS